MSSCENSSHGGERVTIPVRNAYDDTALDASNESDFDTVGANACKCGSNCQCNPCRCEQTSETASKEACTCNPCNCNPCKC